MFWVFCFVNLLVVVVVWVIVLVRLWLTHSLNVYLFCFGVVVLLMLFVGLGWFTLISAGGWMLVRLLTCVLSYCLLVGLLVSDDWLVVTCLLAFVGCLVWDWLLLLICLVGYSCLLINLLMITYYLFSCYLCL